MTDLLNEKAKEAFDGKIVRKDLVSKIKGGANVPVYVLEYLLGMYCASDSEEIIDEGMVKVKKILSENYVRPDEAEKIKSKIKELGQYTVIDKVSVKLDEKKDMYVATLHNLGVSNIQITANYIKDYEKLLVGGIWAILQMSYVYDEMDKKASPFIIMSLKPIQIASLDMNDVFEGRKSFTKDEWIDFLIRSTGMEPNKFDESVKWHLLARLIPLVENNYNLCELGPRGTGKSYVYKEISPNSILISGGQTTVANLFYSMGSKQVGLVGYWDVVAFDEVAGIKFKDKDGIQIMKDYMASGSFARGKEEINANASMVFVGNINQTVENLVKTANLFVDFPTEMNSDCAFFDRMHNYVPGWEIPKMRPDFFTKEFGFIVDYLAEMFRELRKVSHGDAFDKYFAFGRELNQRDVIAVRKSVSGFVKLLYPDGNFTKEEIEEIMVKSLAYRRRVKEQLKKIGGMEFYDTKFSYINRDSGEEMFVSLKEQGGGKLIPEGNTKAGCAYTIGRSENGVFGLYKIESEMLAGKGRFDKKGLGSNSKAKESVETAFDYLKANHKRVSGVISVTEKDYYINLQDIQNVGITSELSLASFIALCSASLNRSVQSQMVVLGTMTLSGTIHKLEELANILQVCSDTGAKKILLPLMCAMDFGSVPPDLLGQFQPIFYNDPIDAVRKSLGIDF